jgi:hypothetical protein
MRREEKGAGGEEAVEEEEPISLSWSRTAVRRLYEHASLQRYLVEEEEEEKIKSAINAQYSIHILRYTSRNFYIS